MSALESPIQPLTELLCTSRLFPSFLDPIRDHYYLANHTNYPSTPDLFFHSTSEELSLKFIILFPIETNRILNAAAI